MFYVSLWLPPATMYSVLKMSSPITWSQSHSGKNKQRVSPGYNKMEWWMWWQINAYYAYHLQELAAWAAGQPPTCPQHVVSPASEHSLHCIFSPTLALLIALTPSPFLLLLSPSVLVSRSLHFLLFFHNLFSLSRPDLCLTPCLC